MYPQSMFRAKIRKMFKKKSSENEHFYSREILLYIVWACLRNVISIISLLKLYFATKENRKLSENEEANVISMYISSFSFIPFAISHKFFFVFYRKIRFITDNQIQ